MFYGSKSGVRENVVYFDLYGYIPLPRARNQIFSYQEHLKLSSRGLQMHCPI